MWTSMGTLWSYPSSHTVLMLGFENVGKTYLLYRLVSKKNKVLTPTIGFNAESFHKTTIFDVAGGFSNLWHTYYDNATALIYVVDGYDFSMQNENKKTLHKILKHDSLHSVPLLVCVNRKGQKEPIDELYFRAAFRLDFIKNRKWDIIGFDSSDGINEIRSWIRSNVEC